MSEIGAVGLCDLLCAGVQEKELRFLVYILTWMVMTLHSMRNTEKKFMRKGNEFRGSL